MRMVPDCERMLRETGGLVVASSRCLWSWRVTPRSLLCYSHVHLACIHQTSVWGPCDPSWAKIYRKNSVFGLQRSQSYLPFISDSFFFFSNYHGFVWRPEWQRHSLVIEITARFCGVGRALWAHGRRRKHLVQPWLFPTLCFLSPKQLYSCCLIFEMVRLLKPTNWEKK